LTTAPRCHTVVVRAVVDEDTPADPDLVGRETDTFRGVPRGQQVVGEADQPLVEGRDLVAW
jgi:hypothetical protein